jgi:hypothetical protein
MDPDDSTDCSVSGVQSDLQRKLTGVAAEEPVVEVFVDSNAARPKDTDGNPGIT